MYLLINKALTSMDFGQLKQLAENTYHVNVAAVFPLTEDMLLLASRGVFILQHPKHPWSKELFKVANLVMEA